jgi:hypothetical protein
MAATRIAKSNGLESVPSRRWIELRDKLRALPGDDFYARWARAFCAEAP